MPKKKKRKTLDQIPRYPNPQQLYKKLISRSGWFYKTKSKRSFFLSRDRSLVSLLYLGDFRISEVLPLTKADFVIKKNFVLIEEIRVSKRKKGNIQFREAKIPLEGERVPFTNLILEYLNLLKPEQRLYPWSLRKRIFESGTYRLKDGTEKPILHVETVGTHRAWQIVNALFPEYTQHWLRAFGYNYDYDVMDHDLLAVSDKTKVDPRSLQPYLRRRYEKYPVR